MKQLFVLMACVLVLAGCSNSRRAPMPAWTPVAVTPAAEQPKFDASGNAIDYIPFRAGVSSASVENLLKQQGCVGGQGAGLTSPQGPVETYRMVCEDKRVFTARCEMRQCKVM